VLDRNTALYSLQLYRGVGEQFTIEYDGRAIQFEVVGLLADSVLQGMLLIGELDFQRSFSDQSGYRFFLIDAPMGMKAKMAEDLQERFADEGLQLGDTKTLLASLLAVQNTYLQTFQALGSLGLLLGTLGLATVQFRNVLERQRELSVLRAVGFRPGKLAGLVFRENLVLLTVGLSVGIVCAAGAVLPYQWLSGNPIPIGQWVLMLGLVWVGGVLSGLLAVRAVVKLPLLAGLQNE
jgi:ABC-type antimicrobial peptide transport system permease subunit